MDMIQGYCSSDTSINEEQNSVENDTVEAGVDELSPRQVRYVYTAKQIRINSQQDTIKKGFETDTVKVLNLVCSLEKNSKVSGQHYHAAIKLNNK